jgi:hypothetical protein
VDGAGATLDVGVVVVVDVVLLLGPLLPPPQPTASTSTAAPPKSATAVLASDLIANPTLHTHHPCAVHVSVPRIRMRKRVKAGSAANAAVARAAAGMARETN